jgi:2-octaprenyl-6-methoxyphenol hydroxylase
MAKQRFNTDIVVIGGGIAGLALAVLLGRAGIGVHLVDPKGPEPLKDVKPAGRTVALMQSSLNIIKATGAWNAIAEHGGALKTMRIIDDSRTNEDSIQSEFYADDIGLEQFGFNIPNPLLRSSLFETVKKIKNVTLHVPGALKTYETKNNSVLVTLEDGTEIEARLLVGADGRNSAVRKIAGIDTWQKTYDQSAITCLINHSQSHNNTSTEFHRSSGPMAFVPLPDNQSSVVWVENTAHADELMKLKKQDFVATLQKASKNILGGITLEAGPECWPLSSLKAKDITAPRLALIAEAAHVMSPITAQGLNLSLRDVAALAETVVNAMRVGLDPGAAPILAKFRKRRMIDINTRVFGVNSMNQIVSTDTDMVKGIRRAGLKTVDMFQPLKKIAMQAGLAPQIDQGRLARGEKL